MIPTPCYHLPECASSCGFFFCFFFGATGLPVPRSYSRDVMPRRGSTPGTWAQAAPTLCRLPAHFLQRGHARLDVVRSQVKRQPSWN